MLNYNWGSNMDISNNMIYILLSERLEHIETNKSFAEDHLHYILGRNTLSQSYITGFGTMPPDDIHHRPSIFYKATVPGLLVGGPSQNFGDPFAEGLLNGKPAAKCYVDNNQSYSTNEVTIYWNSALFLALSLLGV
jgi:endoglucanase